MFADVSIVSFWFLGGLGVFTFAVVLALVLARRRLGRAGVAPVDRCGAVARPECFTAHEPLDILESGGFEGMAGWFEVGSEDPAPLQAQDQLAPAARAAGIMVCAVEVPGGEHTFQLWADAFEDSLPWLAARLTGQETVPCPDA